MSSSAPTAGADTDDLGQGRDAACENRTDKEAPGTEANEAPGAETAEPRSNQGQVDHESTDHEQPEAPGQDGADGD